MECTVPPIDGSLDSRVHITEFELPLMEAEHSVLCDERPHTCRHVEDISWNFTVLDTNFLFKRQKDMKWKVLFVVAEKHHLISVEHKVFHDISSVCCTDEQAVCGY